MKTRKIMALLLMLTMITSALFMGGNAFSKTSAKPYRLRNGDFIFEVLGDGTLTAKRFLSDTDAVETIDTLEIPSEFCGYPVTRISTGCMGNWDDEDDYRLVNTLIIPDTVTQIDNEAFKGSLNKVVLGKNVRSLDIVRSGLRAEDEFVSHSKYFKTDSGIVYNSKMTELLYCPKNKVLKKYKLPDSVQKIGIGAFSECQSIGNIDFNNVRVIGKSAFIRSSIKAVNLSSKVQYVGEDAFYRCKELKTLTVKPNKKLSIGECAFLGTGIKSLALPCNAEQSCFKECKSLKKLTITEAVTELKSQLFYACDNLKSVTVPPTVKKIGKLALGYTKIFQNNWITVKVNGFTIKGVKGSAAEKYAKKNGFTFKAVKK